MSIEKTENKQKEAGDGLLTSLLIFKAASSFGELYNNSSSWTNTTATVI